MISQVVSRDNIVVKILSENIRPFILDQLIDCVGNVLHGYENLFTLGISVFLFRINNILSY